MKILITGGCGYIGTRLINKLLKLGHKIISVDTKWFGDHLPKNRNLKNIKCDIRDIEKIDIKNVDAVIHLASIANDDMALINPELSWQTSSLGTYTLLNHCIKNNVKRFIYASSGSVYGIKNEKKVTENLSLKPISTYNKVKMTTERIIQSYKDDLDIFIIRPATVCGYSERMRLDVSVNALTFNALKNKTINVFGGKQIRPNIHIDDMTDLYVALLNTSSKNSGVYNAGFENMSILDIAKLVQKFVKCEIKVKKKFADLRSYRLDSTKLLKIYKPKKKIEDAIIELVNLYNKKILTDKPSYHSIKWLKKINYLK